MTASKSKALREHELSDGSKVLVTKNWTIIDTSWSAEWVLQVREAEDEACHAICGWRSKNGTPCKNYPIDEKFDVDRVGRCGIHNMEEEEELVSMAIVDHKDTIEPQLPAEVKKSSLFRILSTFAKENCTRCKHCSYHLKCDDVDKDNGICIKETTLLETIMTEIIIEYNLKDTIDVMMAFTLAQTFVDYVKTLRYESHFGEDSSIKDGRASLRIQLNRLLIQNQRSLAIDRKTRQLILKDGDNRTISKTTLSELMSSSKVIDAEFQDIIPLDTGEIFRDRKFIGSDGEPIVDELQQ